MVTSPISSFRGNSSSSDNLDSTNHGTCTSLLAGRFVGDDIETGNSFDHPRDENGITKICSPQSNQPTRPPSCLRLSLCVCVRERER